MLSAVIHARHSYGAVQLVLQPPDQRSVHFGPLVLETDLLKNQRLQQIKTNLSHALCLAIAAYSRRRQMFLRGTTVLLRELDYNFSLAARF